MSNEQKTKRLQRIIAGCLGSIILLICFGIVKFFDSTPKIIKKDKTTTEKTFDTAANRIDFQEIWRLEIETKEKQLQEQINHLNTIIKNQQKEGDNKIEEMQGLINNLNFEKNKPQSLDLPENTVNSRSEQLKITKLSLNLTKPEEVIVLPSIDSSIPAGSFAEAVLLSGVDATAAVSAGANPRPMLLRLTDLTVLPRKFRTDLVDCHCTASAWGELSSERIHARLVTLSCVERDTGEILEVPVNGYIAGSDGKEGIRGTVASKEGQFLSKSLWGGIFAGIGSTLSPANRATSGGPFLSIGTPEQSSTKDLFKSGFGESTNNSLTKLSEYYIKRAEQIQPVIQISAGQKVDLVFTEGVAIDKTLIRKRIAQKNDVERKEQVGS
ncbi:MAG: TraB/VirB10 family protein [Gammaproteobacteria bacterium]